MLIAIDYDLTYTQDPDLWDRFIEMAKDSGHLVICITARRDTPENREIVDPGVPVFFTSLGSKLHYAQEVLKITVDVWIDDDPRALVQGH